MGAGVDGVLSVVVQPVNAVEEGYPVGGLGCVF